MKKLEIIEKKIIQQLIHKPSLTFNELWSKQGESNNFAYHLGKIVERGLVEKSGDGKYKLTDAGIKLSAFVEGDTGCLAAFPTLTVVMIVKKGDKYLCQKRLKQPFFGVWGFPSGKINFGHNLFECARRDLEEEAGLISNDWKLKALEQVKTYDKEKLLFHHYILHVQTEKFSGELISTTHKAQNKWMTLDEYKQKETFPSEKFFSHILPAKAPIMLEAQRYMANGKFVGMNILSVTKF